jgi:molybdopterin-biosynthesis enzyme MoeA-like protein
MDPPSREERLEAVRIKRRRAAAIWELKHLPDVVGYAPGLARDAVASMPGLPMELKRRLFAALEDIELLEPGAAERLEKACSVAVGWLELDAD